MVRSVLGGELYFLDDAVDLSLVLKQDLKLSFSMEVPLVEFTDSSSLFNVVIRS